MSFVSSLLAGCVFKFDTCLQRDQTETDTSSQILLLLWPFVTKKTHHQTWFKFVWHVNGPDVRKRLQDSWQVDFVCRTWLARMSDVWSTLRSRTVTHTVVVVFFCILSWGFRHFRFHSSKSKPLWTIQFEYQTRFQWFVIACGVKRVNRVLLSLIARMNYARSLSRCS